MTVRAPDGTSLGMAYVGPSGAFIDSFPVTQTGTYQIVVDPSAATGGSMAQVPDKAAQPDIQSAVRLVRYFHLQDITLPREDSETIGNFAIRYSMPSRRASTSFFPTRASSGSVNMQKGIRRLRLVRLLPLRFACTML